MKLHIGCGSRYLEGWTNLDINSDTKVDIIDDARTLDKVVDSTCEIIYASHVLEHFGRSEFLEILKVWNSKLKTGGVLRLSVPNFDSVVCTYNKTKDLNQLLGLLYGGQKDAYDYHKIIFNKKTLTLALLDSGFSNIREWDWKKADHSDVDDYSQAYLPHMNKTSGTLMSLNLEATK